VAGRNRTCDASRFKRPLYQSELRPREWARLDSNQHLLVCKTSTLPLSYSPVSVPRQGVEPRPPRSERGVLPVRRSRTEVFRLSRPAVAERCFLCHSPTLRPWIADRRLCTCGLSSSYVEGFWSPSLVSRRENRRLKQTLVFQRTFPAPSARVFLSQAGPRFDLELFQAEHHLWFRHCTIAFKTTKATRWVALYWLAMRLRN
jgi:hypothetical protein